MAIRDALQSGYMVSWLEDQPLSTESDISIAFAFNSGYLECFKVFLQSLLDSGSFIDAQLIVYTDDKQMLSDKFLRAVCDKLVLISESVRSTLYALAENNVKRQERDKWNKGTFLKWAIFEHQDNANLIFFDVDMICLQQMNELPQLHKEKDFLCVPQFKKALTHQKESIRPPVEIHNNLVTMIEQRFVGSHTSRINSGMMVVRNGFLSKEFFSEVTSYASKNLEIHEQGHLSRYFASQKDSLKMISAKYNFQESYLRDVPLSSVISIIADVKVLHYAGTKKPWKNTHAINVRPAFELWHNFLGRLVGRDVI